MNNIKIYPGITISFFTLTKKYKHIHKAVDNILEINYCKEGRLEWDMGNGNKIFLGHGDFSIHTTKTCTNSQINLPTDYYNGLKISIDLNKLKASPIKLLEEAKIKTNDIYSKFCKNKGILLFAENEQTKTIFSYFYDQPKDFQITYYKLKFIELILYLSQIDLTSMNQLKEYQNEQIAVIKEIHNYMLNNLNLHITINSLSKQFLLNPTTLKSTFKAVYGDSIAAHMKGHRMECASKLLATTNLSLAEISRKVGYENQSKFTEAFKKFYHTLPKEYRKKYKRTNLKNNIMEI